MQLVTHKRRVALCCAALAMAGTLALAAHGAPSAGATEDDSAQTRSTPEVRVLEDGSIIQRTPNMPARGNPNGTTWTNYNMDFLQADERGSPGIGSHYLRGFASFRNASIGHSTTG